jgi:hypothetical protein
MSYSDWADLQTLYLIDANAPRSDVDRRRSSSGEPLSALMIGFALSSAGQIHDQLVCISPDKVPVENFRACPIWVHPFLYLGPQVFTRHAK